MITQLSREMHELVAGRDTIRCILEQARTYLARDETWTRDLVAADADGVPTTLTAAHAHRFCAIGAIRRAMVYDLQGTAFVAECRVLDALGVTYRSLIGINDFEGREAVLKVFDAWLEAHPS